MLYVFIPYLDMLCEVFIVFFHNILSVFPRGSPVIVLYSLLLVYS